MLAKVEAEDLLRRPDGMIGRAMKVERFADVDGFWERAGEFLVAREAEHNLVLGICSNLRTMPDRYAGPPHLAVVAEGDRIVLAAVRTPPFNLVLSEADDPVATRVLAAGLAGSSLPGVIGPLEHAGAFATEWSFATGATSRQVRTDRIFRLERVRPVRAVNGRLRIALPGDGPWLEEWLGAFALEATGEEDPDLRRTVDRWIAGRGATMFVWDDGGPGSLCGAGGETPNGIRIGPVYTPPERRGRGYASALVAAVSRAQLDAGRRFCFLFTDVTNPTSNHIYQEIGYEPVRDVASWRFT